MPRPTTQLGPWLVELHFNQSVIFLFEYLVVVCVCVWWRRGGFVGDDVCNLFVRLYFHCCLCYNFLCSVCGLVISFTCLCFCCFLLHEKAILNCVRNSVTLHSEGHLFQVNIFQSNYNAGLIHKLIHLHGCLVFLSVLDWRLFFLGSLFIFSIIVCPEDAFSKAWSCFLSNHQVGFLGVVVLCI